ncbi:bla regulator protein blaR1 [Tenacibaculum sp. 190524A02b]|uniref:Bla regulator protein blaR1 n=1 Tax=Tenacibaculum vairaonense TaxID=3137860 RepID=A0ABM9PRI4_9FLAO
MNSLVYLLQVTLTFSVLYVLYKVFLEKLTFHNLNRIVLVLILPVSILIPYSNNFFPSIASKAIKVPVFEYIQLNNITEQLQVVEQPITTSFLNYSSALLFLYVLVLSILLIRILGAIIQLYMLKSNAKTIKKSTYKLVIANVPETFSYFNWIFIPKRNIEQLDDQIIAHEKVHIKLKHSWDVIFTEIYIAFFWFNPLLYLYRKSLKAVHEFQADKGVLNNGVKTSDYLQVLLQNLEISKPNNLYNYFNQSILKKRVTMMTKPKSNSLNKLTYIALLPVCVLLIFAFTSPAIEDDGYLNGEVTSESFSTPSFLFPVKNATKNDITSHFGKKARHPKIKKEKTHKGIDIKAKIGTPVFATADGVISKASLEDKWGNLIVMTHTDGYETWYAHLDGFNVSENQKVKKGEVIGYVGNTGFSTGPHLHYEVKQHGKHLNPLDYLE